MTNFSQQISAITTKEEILNFIEFLQGQETELSYDEKQSLYDKIQLVKDDMQRNIELPRPVIPSAREVINRIRNSGE